MKTSLFLLPAAAILLAACASPPPPPPGSTMSYSGNGDCPGSFSTAAVIEFKTSQPAAILTERRDVKVAESPCYAADGTNRPYMIYRLPTSGTIASIQAGSIPEPGRLFASELVFLKADMSVSRTVSKEGFLQRGSSWSALVRPVAGEAYVAIVADPSLIGENFYYVADPEEAAAKEEEADKKSSPLLANARIQKTSLPYSYEGKVFVRIFFADPKGTMDL